MGREIVTLSVLAVLGIAYISYLFLGMLTARII
jgi:hypothetical protein